MLLRQIYENLMKQKEINRQLAKINEADMTAKNIVKKLHTELEKELEKEKKILEMMERQM